MLVVIGIIILLIGVLLPAINRAYKRSIAVRMKMDIQTIVTALEAYKTDMRDYPSIDYTDVSGIMTAQNPGSQILCWALLAPGNQTQDGYGADPNNTGSGPYPAPGFTIRPKGQVYGPYVEISRFKIGHDNPAVAGTPPALSNGEPDYFFQDRYGHPILYFKASMNSPIAPNAATGTQGNFVGDMPAPLMAAPPYYNLSDNPNAMMNSWASVPYTRPNALISMQIMLGDSNHNGQIDPGEQPATTHSYLLWSPGPDEMIGVDVTQPNFAGIAGDCDDATNFKL